MKSNSMQILIVADDSKIIATLASEIVARLDAGISIVDTVREGREMIQSEVFDVALVAPVLSDGPAASLTALDATPIVLLDQTADVGRLLESFRSGIVDVIDPRADAGAVIDRIERVVTSARRRQRTVSRNRRLRRVSSRLIKDRRELRQRVDLICRDLVQAYQRLAQKVVSTGAIHHDADYTNDEETY